MAAEVVVPASRLRRFCYQVARKLEVPEDDADILAGTLVDADLRGVHTHGSSLLPGYARRLQAGGTKRDAPLTVIQDGPAVAAADGNAGIGQVIATRAMRLAIDKARHAGIGAVSVRNSNHFGAAATYSMLALPNDMIGFATTNAGTRVPPFGGASAVIGNNPLSYAIPAGTERPIVLDMAQSVVAAGKLAMAQRKGEKIPVGWALDVDGNPTDDPKAGLAGLLLPLAGPKGFGMAVVMDVLSGALSGGAVGMDLSGPRPAERPFRVCHFFMAIDIGRFVEVSEFKSRVDQVIRDTKAARKAPGVSEIYLPGEIEFELRERREREGIPLLASLVDDLEALGADFGLDTADRRLTLGSD